MPYKVGKKNSSGWPILKEGKVIGHSTTKAKAEASIRAREAGKHNPNW